MEENKFVWQIINRRGREYIIRSSVSRLSMNENSEWIFVPFFVDGEESRTCIRKEDIFMIKFNGTIVPLKKEE